MGRFTIDRRTTLKWLALTVLASNVRLASPASSVAPLARGYGTDPDLVKPTVPWPRTLSSEELRTVAALCDLLLPDDGSSPAASAVGVHEFVDEWVSAPYPDQQADRKIILAGLEWVERQARQSAGSSFHEVSPAQQIELFERLIGKREPKAQFDGSADFYPRFRYICLGAYYTTEPGIAALGHIGNQPIAGDYPGPSPEALEHLNRALRRLGLTS